MKAWQRNVLIGILAVVVLVGGFFGIRAIIEANESGDVTDEVVSVVGRETIANIVAKFNAQINETTQKELKAADEKAMVTYENNYWFPLEEGVSLVVVPEEFTSNVGSDIAKVALIYTNKDENNRHLAEEYWQYLAQANNLELSEAEVTDLLKEAAQRQAENNTTDIVKGISAAIFEDDNHFELQVLRNY